MSTDSSCQFQWAAQEGAGLGFGLLTLLIMAVKTGLHGHGPEFSPAEISWVIDQIPLWSLVGLLAGLGVGIVAIGWGGS